MAIAVNQAPHVLDLTGGKSLARGESANIDPNNPHEAAYISEGYLSITDGTIPPIPPADPTGTVLYLDDHRREQDLPPSTPGWVLSTQGVGNPPVWEAVEAAGIPNSSITIAKLAFDPATQVELDAESALRAAIVGLQVPVNAVYTTASLAAFVAWPAAGESGVIAMYKGWRIRRITTDRAARVRLYSTPAKRDADVARPLTTDPPDYPTIGAAPDHGCMFEAITDATHLDLPVAPNVSGAELTPSNNVPIRVDNLGTTGTVTVTVYYQRIEP